MTPCIIKEYVNFAWEDYGYPVSRITFGIDGPIYIFHLFNEHLEKIAARLLKGRHRSAFRKAMIHGDFRICLRIKSGQAVLDPRLFSVSGPISIAMTNAFRQLQMAIHDDCLSLATVVNANTLRLYKAGLRESVTFKEKSTARFTVILQMIPAPDVSLSQYRFPGKVLRLLIRQDFNYCTLSVMVLDRSRTILLSRKVDPGCLYPRNIKISVLGKKFLSMVHYACEEARKFQNNGRIAA